LHHISVQITQGEVLFLLGRNGCGKTTLMRCLSGILQPDSGSVLFDGRDIRTIPPAERARRIGLIPQIHSPAFAYTVHDIVLMGRAPYLGLFDKPGKTDHMTADAALERMDMLAFRDRPYTQLSGGQRQMVMIARGLAQQCDILLMDEPDAHLDPGNQHLIMDIVRTLVRENLTFVISSHVPNHALAYADRVLLMGSGRTLALGVPSETLTETLLSRAYDLDMEIIYQDYEGQRIPRAILPRRNGDLW
jgi:ABC-type cobalamin/Fe3+-siderophores transport system ATPase subunit